MAAVDSEQSVLSVAWFIVAKSGKRGGKEQQQAGAFIITLSS